MDSPFHWYDPITVAVPVCNCPQGKGEQHCHPDNSVLAPLWAVPNYFAGPNYYFEIIPRPRWCRFCDMYGHLGMAYYKQGLYWQCERCHNWINGVTDDLRDRN